MEICASFSLFERSIADDVTSERLVRRRTSRVGGGRSPDPLGAQTDSAAASASGRCGIGRRVAGRPWLAGPAPGHIAGDRRRSEEASVDRLDGRTKGSAVRFCGTAALAAIL